MESRDVYKNWGIVAGMYCMIFWSNAVFGQEKLDLNEAIAIAMKNNYSILLAKDSLQIARNHNAWGNTGAFPSLSVNGGFTQSDNTLDQTFATSSTSKNGVISNTNFANVGLNWILFNGLKPFVTKRRFSILVHQGEYQVKAQMESTIVQVMRAYYNLIRLVQATKVTKETLSIDDERIKISEKKFNIGSGNKLDLLQAKVDRNQQQSQYLAQKNGIDSARVGINQLLARDLKIVFEPVDTSIVIHYQPSYEAIVESALQKNKAIKIAFDNIRIQELIVKERKADLFPILLGSAGYYHAQTNNSAGFTLLNRTLGPQFGVSLSWNLFNGSISKIKVADAKVNLDRADYMYKNQYQSLLAGINVNFIAFQNAMAILRLEEENVLLARENLKIALQKYRLGASTQIELMIAEQSLESSLNRLVTARYAAKINEINLLLVSGNLIN